MLKTREYGLILGEDRSIIFSRPFPFNPRVLWSTVPAARLLDLQIDEFSR
ncbi:MAG: hypothetical protein NWE88_13270 [Candidatus Bathyarchaeota archaeon]|jgi:hypothetical protein|nr:hypothetical protein [Candidatus Bathyarchaeota archaeon]